MDIEKHRYSYLTKFKIMMKLKCHCGMVEAEINLENFNKIGQKTYELLEDTGRHILRAIACYLELEETYFDKHIFNGNSILRAIHYPPITEEPKKAERAAAHGDINLITLLMGAQGRGLQVLNNKGEWVDAIAEDDEIIVNIGDI